MHFLLSNLYLGATVLFLLLRTSKGSIQNHVEQGVISWKIVVDRSGQGDFPSVQKAIDSIPPNNNLWVLIFIKAGIYNEKIMIPQDKPFIVLQGESSKRTIIQWNKAGSATESSTFILRADNFKAADILFRNTYNLIIPKGPDGNSIIWAPAASLYGDKASFHRCGFSGVQDTLTDMQGRHFFNSSYVEGAIDFIWGAGQSVYERCHINATTGILNGTAGYITAQGRENVNDANGFVFFSCVISASGPVYLGRAYRKYSRVIFSRTYMPHAIMPTGWQAWNYIGREHTITYSEHFCTGPGSDTSKRVKWEKALSSNEWRRLTYIDIFLNADGWIEAQPNIQ